jgi:S-layer protein
MGAGNDTVVYAGPMGAGGSVDSGTGIDTIKMTAAQAVTATGSTTFAGTVSNFEKLELSTTTGAARAINMANADGINSLVLNGVDTGALTVTNAAANFTYTNKAAVASASSISLASDTGTSDVVNVIYTANDGFADTAAMTIANVETINISTLDADTTAQTTKFTANLVTAAAKTINISGDTGVTLTDTSTSMTTVDASGLTGTVAAASGFTWTTGALAASSTIKGSAAATNTVDFSAANTASTSVTYVGGTGNDVITGSNGLNNTVTLGDGTNSFTSAAVGGNNTITGGSGVDTISVGSGNNTISTGAGNDSITFGGGMNTITGGAGNDTFIISAAGANVNTYSTITDASAGDILTFTDRGAETFATAKLTLGDTAVFQDYANLAASGDGSAAGAIKWFQFGGNTYVVEDLSASASFVNGTDLIIKLTGLVDLSTATGAGTHVITLA